MSTNGTTQHFRGFQYTRQHVNKDGSSSYRCSFYRVTKCKARMKISKDGTLTVFKEHEYKCSSKNGIIVKPIEQATSTKPIELSEMMAPTKPPPTFLDYTIEMFEQVDKLAVEDISTSAKKIWNEVSSNFRQQAQDAGSHSYKGISRRQAESHVYRTRNKANGRDIFRTIEAPPVSMVLNSKHNFLQFNFTVPNGDKTERVTGWGNPGLFGVLKIPCSWTAPLVCALPNFISA
jgi:hypothetical protein